MEKGLAEELHIGLKRPALLWFHGGGFSLGSVEGDELKASLLANFTGFTVVRAAIIVNCESELCALCDIIM